MTEPVFDSSMFLIDRARLRSMVSESERAVNDAVDKFLREEYTELVTQELNKPYFKGWIFHRQGHKFSPMHIFPEDVNDEYIKLFNQWYKNLCLANEHWLPKTLKTRARIEKSRERMLKPIRSFRYALGERPFEAEAVYLSLTDLKRFEEKRWFFSDWNEIWERDW